ncbi:NADH dehydrogenase/NADH:ubiquinone oxidoreductase 75 kD subunit [Longilinea arvoryzae]|uniref:NADH dehydrogenase/NADH:ubiquinone oxidoreductase 75 kD subunit n=1 Tax=Longilinea arvoryzae TaxID=360412 RepID=A0A0S7BJZ5_9CHLR|nr:molybdopterin-dependent oxidoreductase [Longilinea arvoryzae]GAP14931.1 NADH dehydrogenase/NADH:ubiquinone oxidoreductase 75 kD subunit [Longilinea arvoryzae]
MINVTIDEKTIQVPEGTTVLQAAKMAGADIPTLCDHPYLKPYGGCRLCLVEVQGFRTLQPACTLPASNNMVINTSTEKVKAARKFVLTLIFSERNHFCPFCEMSGGDCELQNAAYKEGMTHWQLQPNWTPYPVDASHPYFILDNNRCILCRRCVRACGELVGNFTLGFEERGSLSMLIADLGSTPLGESSCISCGSCVQVCPTGAIIERQSSYRGHEIQVEKTDTVCLGCSIGCGVTVETRDNQMVRVKGDWEAAVNGGVICKVGRFFPMDEKRNRITNPMVRKDGALVPVSWDEAMKTIAAQVKPLAGKKSGVAALASTRLPAEALYAFKKLFGEDLKSDLVTTLEEGLSTVAAANLAEKLGKSFEGDLNALDSSDCVVVAGVDLVKEHEVAGFFIKRAQPHGTKLILVDSEANGLDLAADATIKPAKGGMKDTLIALAQKKGSPEITAAAALIAEARHPVFVFGKGIDEAELKALVDLAASVNGVVIGLKGGANSLAASQLHLDAEFKLNGHKAVFVALGDDFSTQKIEDQLKGIPFVVVQTAYATPLADHADVILPVETWAELEGHYLNLEGRLQEAHPSLKAPQGIYTNLKAIETLAAALGCDVKGDWKAELVARTPAVALVA